MNNPPGPRGREVSGFVTSTLPFLQRTAKRYGPMSYFRVLHQHFYLVDEPELIQEILVTRQHLFIRDTGATLLRELVGDGLLTRDEPAHRERRRALQPAFHRAQVASYAGMMVAESVREAGRWRDGERIEVDVEMRRLTLSIVGASLFGQDFCDSADGIAEALANVVKKARGIAPLLSVIEPLVKAYRRVFANGRSLFFQRERAKLERILAPVIEQRRGSKREDILSLLLEQLDERDAANEVVTLVLAGHETTATALTWAWYLLAQHPAVERCLHEELDRVLGDRDATFEDLAHLTFTTMIFTETMRLYPPAPAFGRRPVETLKLSGYEVKPGSSIILSPFITHRNPRFFPDPDQFRPDRWEKILIPKFAYFPFGGGAKMCIGDTFARLEGVLVLATIARRWRLVRDEGGNVGINPGITLRPDGPVWMRLESRAR